MIAPARLSQLGRLTFLFKDSVLYGGAAAISKAFALITFPLLARQLSVVDYGVLDFFLVLSSLVTLLFVFGQDSAVARFFYEHEDDEARRQLISQSLAFQVGLLLLAVPVLWFAAEYVTRFLVDSPQAVLLFRIVLLQLPFLLLLNFSQNLLKWNFQRRPFMILSLGSTVVQAGLLVFVLFMLDAGPGEILLVYLAVTIGFGLLGIWFVRAWLAWPQGFAYLRCMLPYAIPFGLICVLGAFLPALERNLTNELLGAHELGLYAAGAKIAMLVGIVVSAFQTAWGPFSLSLYKQDDAGHTYNAVLRVFTLLVCVMVLGLSLVAETLIYWLASERYVGAAVVVFPLALGLAMQAIGWITEIGISISKRSHLGLYGYVVAVIVTVAGIMWLAPRLGLVGVAAGVLAGQASRAAVSSWLAQRAWPLPWRFGPVLFVGALTLTVGFASLWVGQVYGELGQRLALSVGIFAVLVIGGRVLFTIEEIMRAYELVRRYL